MNAAKCVWQELRLDEACVILNRNNQEKNAASLYSLSSDCVLCPYGRVSSIHPGSGNASLGFNTATSLTWRVYNDSGLQEFRSTKDESGLICQFEPNLGEYGMYELTIDDRGCEFDAIVEPSDPYTPLGIIIGVVICLLFGFRFLGVCSSLVRNKCQKRSDASDSTTNNSNDQIISSPGKTSRVLSIDTFRGMSIMMMIFVNNGAGGYTILEHATWNGLLVGDLVFPCFVWIMGICIPISISSQLVRGVSRLSIVGGILKRSILLFLIDLSLNTLTTDPDFKTMRIFGVLQRFGVAYFFVGISYTLLSDRNEDKYRRRGTTSAAVSRFADLLSLWPQWILIFIITGVHCGITFYLPLPDGCPTGYLGPGGRHAEGRYSNCTGGAAGYIDRIILGRDHLYQRPSIDRVYGSGPFDPEGILGCLTTILQTFLGVQTGKILRVYKGWKDRVVGWLLLGIICGSIGCALHFTDLVPINKNLWSLSFVFATTSFALALFTATYLLIDVTNVWRGGPFRIPGMNALVMYIGHKMCYRIFPFHWRYGETTSHAWTTIAGIWDVAAWTCVAYVLHRKKIYVSL